MIENRKNYLDIGCGTEKSGYISVPVGSLSVVVDRDTGTLGHRGDVRSGEAFPVCADAGLLPFEDESFDEISETHLLEHLPAGDEAKALGELSRVLKPGGKAVIATPHPNYERVMGKIVAGYHSPNMHQQIFTPQRLRESVEQAGMEVEEERTQRWESAANLVRLALVSRFFPNKVTFKFQVGFEIKNKNSVMVKGKRHFGKIIGLVKKTPIPRIMYKAFPYETYIEAVKKI